MRRQPRRPVRPDDKVFSSEEARKVSRLQWRYNLLGLAAIIIIIILATDMGGCSRWLAGLFGK